METFSALLAICARNSPVTGEFPTQRPVTRSFDIFFDLRMNCRENNGEAGDLRSLRAHYDVIVTWYPWEPISTNLRYMSVHGLFEMECTANIFFQNNLAYTELNLYHMDMSVLFWL